MFSRLTRLALIALLVVAPVIAFACGAQPWLLAVPALFLLGRSYGSAAQPSGLPGADYRVGAALADFTPHARNR